jgi:hypothetical protein
MTECFEIVVPSGFSHFYSPHHSVFAPYQSSADLGHIYSLDIDSPQSCMEFWHAKVLMPWGSGGELEIKYLGIIHVVQSIHKVD